MFFKCELCKKECKDFIGLGVHVGRAHKKEITIEEYYNKFIRNNIDYGKYNPWEGLCKTCGKKTKFINLKTGYSEYCNLNCANRNKQRRKQFSSKRKGHFVKKETREILSKKIKDIWNNENSIYKEKKFKEKLSDSLKKYNEERRNKEMREYILKTSDFEPIEYRNAIDFTKYKCSKCGYIFLTCWNYLQQGKTCPNCGSLGNKSKAEIEITEFLKESGIEEKDLILNRKITIPPKELDIFIKSKKIAIEYNGLYWHSVEVLKNKNQHLEKTKICEEKDIKLIQIFEDEWIFKKEIVKERLKQILGLNYNKPKIYARKCTIKEITSKEKNEFLEKFHIQGKDNSVIKLGAFFKGQLISVMTFSHGNISKGSKYKKDVWELNRFCSDYNFRVIGITGKLLEYFKRNYNWKEIFSYADRRWSSYIDRGTVYKKLKFEFIKETQPNYWYIKNTKHKFRIHRFGLKKTKNDLQNISEQIIRTRQGYGIIYDCGSLKYELKNVNY